MDKFIIKGGNRLCGRVKISGAKNGSLALMPATILAPGTYYLHNTPNLRDVWTMSRLMTELGAFCELNDNDLFVDTRNINKTLAPYEHVKNMRASFYVLGPLLARFGEAKVSLPGGCAWGPRPVDLHIKGMQRLGADVNLENGYIIAKAQQLKGAKIHLDVSSVGATGNILMAATLAKGVTVISNAATEPEITALARMLVKMGAKIDGIGTAILEIEGVDKLTPVNEETNIPDRIEAATYLIAAAATAGTVELQNVNPYHLTAIIAKLEECGCEIDVNSDNIFLKAPEIKKSVDITAAVYPGIPTDIQPQWTALMASKCDGNSKITDPIYTDRFKHIPELIRMGADIDVVKNAAFVKSNPEKSFTGAQVMASDLRAGAALIIAALATNDITEILRVYHIDRGYESIENKLISIGANIKRVKTDLI